MTLLWHSNSPLFYYAISLWREDHFWADNPLAAGMIAHTVNSLFSSIITHQIPRTCRVWLALAIVICSLAAGSFLRAHMQQLPSL